MQDSEASMTGGQKFAFCMKKEEKKMKNGHGFLLSVSEALAYLSEIASVDKIMNEAPLFKKVI